MVCLRLLNSDILRNDPGDGCCDDGNELSCSTQICNFLFKLSGYQLMKDTSLAFSLSITLDVKV